MDIKRRKKLNILLAEFASICDEYDIWYALDAGTLLGSVRHGGFIPWQEKLQVMMTAESYIRFERRMGERVIDNYKYSWYSQNTPSFIEGKGEIDKDEPFIKIRLIIPTDRHKVKKYYSLFRVLSDMKKKTNYKEAIHDLLSENHDSFSFIGPSRFDKRKTANIQVFNFDTTDLLFNGIKVKVPVDYKRILETWYGEDYMDASVPSTYYIYDSPLTKFKVKHAKNT